MSVFNDVKEVVKKVVKKKENKKIQIEETKREKFFFFHIFCENVKPFILLSKKLKKRKNTIFKFFYT